MNTIKVFKILSEYCMFTFNYFDPLTAATCHCEGCLRFMKVLFVCFNT